VHGVRSLFLNRGALAGAAALLLGVAALAAAPLLGTGKLGDAVDHLSTANPWWLWLGATSLAASLVCMGSAWCAGLRSCGGSTHVWDSTARYATGSLVNAVAPAGCGGAVRAALFSRVLPGEDRLWRTGGIAAAVAAARALVLAPLVVAAAVIAGLTLKPALILLGAVLLAVGVAFAVRSRTPKHHVAHVFDAFRALANAPREAGRLAGWIGFTFLGRLAAAACVAAAVGVHSPLRAALVAVPAIALANVLPLTPGNVGVASGAVALALAATGLDGGTAIAVGIAIHALETVVGVAAGAASALYLARPPAWSLRVGAAAGSLALVGGFGATVFI
jgi:uncharacterized membrane protein YbhN (UPF0104 family)